MQNCIRELRRQKGISQEALAKACGVTRQTVNAIENNKYDPTLALAFALARELGTPFPRSPIHTAPRWTPCSRPARPPERAGRGIRKNASQF